MASSDRKVVSQFPYPPTRYIHNCATDRPMPPPAPPSTGNYRMFGRDYRLDDDPAAIAAGNAALARAPNAPKPEQLYDNLKPPTAELRRLNTQLIELFLQLVRLLCTAPTMPADQAPHEALTKRIEAVFTNMQQLINLLRPAQAAMDLKALLDRQTAARKNMTAKLKDAYSKAWDLVSDAADSLSTPSVPLSDACVAAPLDSLTNNAVNTTTATHSYKGKIDPMDSAQLNQPGDSKIKSNPQVDADELVGFEPKPEDESFCYTKPPSDQLQAQLSQLALDPSL